jgi:hypothetical protein
MSLAHSKEEADNMPGEYNNYPSGNRWIAYLTSPGSYARSELLEAGGTRIQTTDNGVDP